MMIEMSLKEYRDECEKISFPADLKTAGLLVVPNNALFKVKMSDAEKDEIIEKAANIIRQFSPWLFYRSSWTEYFFLSKQAPDEIGAIIDERVRHEANAEPVMGLWKKLVLSFDEGEQVSSATIRRMYSNLQDNLSEFE